MYTKKVLQHFKHPHNQGRIKNPDAVGEVGNPICGDIMKIYLKIASAKQKTTDKKQRIKSDKINLNNFIIKDIKFETLGCAAAIAVSSALTDVAKGKTLEQAKKINKDQIIKNLGGLPTPKIHCSMLGIEALRKAIKNIKHDHYYSKNKKYIK